MSEYNLCSLLVHTRTEQMNQVEKILTQQDGVEVHANTEDGRLIVTVEADSRRDVAQQIMDVQDIKGVLSASMIYQFSDDINENDDLNKFESNQARISA